MPRILAPDGTIREFPDDMSMADIGEVMAREFPKPSAARASRKAEPSGSAQPSSARAVPPARRGIPVVISRSAPTSLSVRLAQEFGITLIGFVRGKRMNVYAGGWRIQ